MFIFLFRAARVLCLAGPERRSRPDFEQRLYQTAISAKLSAEWQAGSGISHRRVRTKMLFCQKRYRCQGAKVRDVFQEKQADGTAAKQRGIHLPFIGKPPSRPNDRGRSAGKKQQKEGPPKDSEREKRAEKKGNDRQDQGKRNKDKRNNNSRNKDSPQRENRQETGRACLRQTAKPGRTGSAGLRTGFPAAAKKQACAIAGPATRPEGRHTIFISAHPECASQRRESSYRPA